MGLAMNDLKNASPKILVIGDLMIDHYLWGSCNRVSPEAPVQVVKVDMDSLVLGGAGNVINNLKVLGASVDMISVIGECDASKELLGLFDKINVETKYLAIQKDRVTSKKSRIIAAQQQVVRFDSESSEEINEESIQSVIGTFKSIFLNYDIILLSDYGKGILTYDLTQSLISIASENRIKVLVDPKGKDYSKYKGAYLLTPNKKEASEATKIEIKDQSGLKKAIKALKDKYDLAVSLITLSEQGVAVFDNDLRLHPTVAKEVFDVTGAGDTILAAMGFALACNKSIDESIKFANLAAGIVVGKIGAATASLEEIIHYESKLNQISSDNYIKSWNDIKSIVTVAKNNKQNIVFTNGCFDILHVGHVKYLEKSKSYGDILIVGLNSDSSVKKIKGDSRPINSEYDRAYLLASTEAVDYVVIFNEETPFELINHIKPDILTKGSDYSSKEVVGKDLVKELKLIELTDGKSTSSTIKRILSTK